MQSSGIPAPEKRNTLRNISAVLLGILPIYAFVIRMHYSRGGSYTVNDMLLYPLIAGGGWIIVLLVLYRYMCGKRISNLNRSQGVWWKDILIGIALAAGLLVLFFLQQSLLNLLFPSQPPSQAIIKLFSRLSRDPVLLAVWIGPVVWIGVALFEELQRVFMLDLLWDLTGSALLRWLVIMVSALLFAFAHVYQGTANMIGIFIAAVILGIFYMKSGRILPMIVAHGLYDSLQLIMAVIQIRQAGL